MKIKEFIEGWIIKADKEEDEYYKFFTYYLALNYLYNHEFEEVSSEKERLVLFISKTVCNKEFNDFKITIDKKSELIKQQIKDMRSNRNSKIYKLDDVKNGNIVSIFLMIYQIRCNLFHGEKELHSDRDKNLVKEANVILKQFLKKVLGDLTNE